MKDIIVSILKIIAPFSVAFIVFSQGRSRNQAATKNNAPAGG